MRPDSLLRLWRYINHLLRPTCTYLPLWMDSANDINPILSAGRVHYTDNAYLKLKFLSVSQLYSFFALQCRRLKEKLATTEAELSTLQNGKLAIYK